MIQKFEDLEVWKESLKLARLIYTCTKSFPKEEQFALTNQIRRASYSVSANIAEGFGRSTSRDKLHFYTIAYGSLLETKNFLYLAKELEYIDIIDHELEQVISCQKLLNAFMRPLKEKAKK